jgi:hypothetical protein
VPNQARSWPGTASLAVAVTLLNWPTWRRLAPGLDLSWQAGIALAFTRHMQWGPVLDFTYGPYGFAGFIEPYSRATALIAIFFVFSVTVVLSALIVSGLRRFFPDRSVLQRAAGLAVAGIITWAVIGLSWSAGRAADFAGVAGLGLAVTALRPAPVRVRTTLLVTLGALAGFSLLVKFDTGIVLLGLLVVALVAVPADERRLRLSALSGLTAVAVFVIAWSTAGQSFGHLVGFAHSSLSLALGYSSAMGGSLPGTSIVWRALAIGAIAMLCFVVALAHRPARERVAVGLMFAGWGWAVVKDDFVSGNHFVEFFRIMLVVIAMTSMWTGQRLVYAGALVLAALATHAVGGAAPVRPLTGLRAIGTELADIAQPSRFSGLTASARWRVLRADHISPQLLSRLRGFTFAVEPWEDMVAWAAPGLRWDPEPVLQSYSAYTNDLDRADASFLSSERAPQRVLYLPLSFDRRDPSWDPPATMEALYCHYGQDELSGPWLVLARVPNRCGASRFLGTVHARFGQRVTVPDPKGEMVVATFTVTTPVLATLDNLVLKSPASYVSLWGERGVRVTYHFVLGTAGEDHVLNVPPALGYSAPFTPAPTRQLEFSGDGWNSGHGSVAIVFTAVAMGPAKAL